MSTFQSLRGGAGIASRRMGTHPPAVAFDVPLSRLDLVDEGLKVARAISGAEAFRRYDWLHNVRAVNRAGNFRGMVVSAGWSTTFHFTDDAADKLSKVGLWASLALNVAESAPRVEQILNSDDPWNLKGAQIATQVDSICLRTLLGGIPGAADVLAWSARSVLGLAGAAGVKVPRSWSQNIGSFDNSVNSTFNTVTDGENIYLVVDKYFGY